MTIYWPHIEMHPDDCSGGTIGPGRHAAFKSVAIANDNQHVSMYDVFVIIEFLDSSGRPDRLEKGWRVMTPGTSMSFDLGHGNEVFLCPDPDRPPLAIRIEYRDADKRRWAMRYGCKPYRLNGFGGWRRRAWSRVLRQSDRPAPAIRA